MNPNKKVLIIEDNQELCEMFCFALSLLEIDVDCAPDGEDGIRKFLKINPDVVILDIVMPRMDGYSVLKKIKSQNPKSRVVIVSNLGKGKGCPDLSLLQDVLYLRKSEFTPREIAQKIKELL